ncbi:hypothetical protein FACS189444_7140 [Spirochaetia bacterium]|nr:hypothetical protein FACS189444_7140 [Spirochaetia bacterium]
MPHKSHPRPTMPRLPTGTIITIGAALAITIGIIMFNSPRPTVTLRAFFIGPWGSPWFLGNTLDSIALLLTASLGAVLAFRGGCFNLGGEGQIYIGGLAASVVLLKSYAPSGAQSFAGNPPAVLLLCAAALAAILAGGLMGAISGVLKKRLGANELITSFLLSVALTPIADYIITGPLRDHGGNL